MRLRLALCTLGLLAMTVSTQADTILIDDFDGGGVAAASRTITPAPGTYTTGGRMFEVGNRANMLANGAFGLPFSISDDSVVGAQGNTVLETDSAGIFGQAKTDSFFGVSDTVDAVNPSGIGTVTWTINTLGLTNLQLAVDVGAMGDFEGTAGSGGAAAQDSFSFAISFDGTNFTPVILFGVDDEFPAGAYRGMDSGNVNTSLVDPLFYLGPDGVLGGGDDVQMNKSDPTTGALDTITANISGTGTSLTLRFQAMTDGTTEGFAFDNVKLIADMGGGDDADFDNDSDVDGEDFLIWQRNLGVGTTNAQGDANGSNSVDAADLEIWKTAFGQPAAGAAISAVPEPAGGLLAMLGGLALLGARRRAS